MSEHAATEWKPPFSQASGNRSNIIRSRVGSDIHPTVGGSGPLQHSVSAPSGSVGGSTDHNSGDRGNTGWHWYYRIGIVASLISLIFVAYLIIFGR